MNNKKIAVTIEGISPLLQHRFPIAVEDAKSKIRNQKQSQDDVESYLYKDDKGTLIQPSDHIIGAMKAAGAKYQIPGRGKSTYKSIMGSGIVCIDPFYIPHEINKWEIDRRPVVIQKARIVRARPMFPAWKLSFVMDFDEDEVPKEVLKEILDYAGRYVGIGDFRPQKGGPFGRFMVTRFKDV